MDLPEQYYDTFSDSYGIIALLCAGLGFITYKKWGGFKSVLGSALAFFSLGLLFQFLGQMSYAYYRIVNGVEVAYPSFGEFFYFGSVPFYIYAIWQLIVSLGGKKVLRTNISQLLFLVIISVFVFLLDYYLILYGYEVTDYGGPLKTQIGTILDYAYPITQATLMSMAIFAYFLARKANGGMLQVPVMFTVFAMYLQYLGDTLYTYRVIHETYYGGDYTDMLYIGSYFLLGIAFIKFRFVQKSLINGRSKQ